MVRLIVLKGGSGYDVSECVEKIVWSGRKGAAPRCLKATLLDDGGGGHKRVSVDCANGDKCVLYEGKRELFRGIIETHSQGDSKKLSLTAYDNMYYLANNRDSFCYSNQTATQIFRDCMARAGMPCGDVAETGYVIPELPKAKTTFYDVLLDALGMTYKATKQRYYVSSEKGKAHLRRRTEQKMQWVLEVGANITGYEYTKSISGVKTRVRLLSKEDAVVYEEANAALEARIGTFMDVQSVDDNYNEAQMKELVQSVFEEKGQPQRALKVSGMGITDAVSGGCVYVAIPHIGMRRTFYIDEDTHTFSGNAHTMSLKLNFARDIGDAG